MGTSTRDPKGQFAVTIRVDDVPQPLYVRHDDGRMFVAGTRGQNFRLIVHNLTNGRLEIVGSVEQVDPLTNRLVDLHCRGLIVEPRGVTVFDGWRHNPDAVDPLVFFDLNRSAAVQSTGIVGVAAFTEAPSSGQSNPFPHEPTIRELDPFGGALVDAPMASRGTPASFVRASGAPSIVEIGYATEAWLRQQRIITETTPEPAAFPDLAIKGYIEGW